MTQSEKYKSADLIMNISFVILTLFSLAVSPMYDTLLFAIPILLLILFAYYFSKILLPNNSLYQYVGSTNLALFTALLIYQMHGMIEMHFIAFVGSILLIYYKKWTLQIPLILIVVVHHAVLGYIQFLGYKEVYFTTADYMDLQTFIIHVLLAAVIFLLCGYWAYIFEKYEKDVQHKTEKLETQMVSINNNVEIANQIAKGNLDTKIETSEDDLLAQSLLVMQQNLLIAKKKEEVENFTNIGIAQCSEILRQSNLSVNDLTMNVLRFLIKYFDSNQGGFFILNNENSNDIFLELTACYAYERQKFNYKRIEIGEGLIGTTFLEKESIYVNKLPKNYLKITSGLGAATPTYLILLPLMVNKENYGVLEMAFFESLEKYKIDLLKKLCEDIASTLSNVKINEQTKRLLESSQQQSEELRAQEEEMRQNMEEMHATQEEMERKQTEISEFQRMTNSIIKSSPGAVYRSKIDKNWTMIYMSDKILHITGYSSHEFMNNSVQLAQIIHSEDVFYVENEVQKALENKNQYELNYRLKHKNNHYVYVWEIGEGVFDSHGNPEFAEGIILDVNDKKLQEMEMHQNMEEMIAIQEEMKKKENEVNKLLETSQINESKLNEISMRHQEELAIKNIQIETLELKLKSLQN